MIQKNKKTFIRVSSFCLSVAALLSFSSCSALKRSLAGELTDQGISIDSVAPGMVYVPQIQEDCITTSVSVDTVYENCLFVGNSVMCDFYNHVSLWRKTDPMLFSKSYFFCNQNFGVYENNYTKVSASSTHPTVKIGDEEVKCTVEDAVEKTGASHVVLCLAGVNDLPVYGDEENCHKKTAADMEKLILSLKKRFGDITVTVISTPYMSASALSMKSVNNEKIKALNDELIVACTKSGAYFIDISTLIADENNCLKPEYSADNYCRINESGCKVILSSLRYYAEKRKGEI